MNRSVLVLAALLGSFGCGDTPSTTAVSYALLADVDIAETISAGDWTIELTRADVAFGPVYFCAANFGGASLCDVAAGESLDDVVLSGIAPQETLLGTVHGLTGPIRSASYDFGIHWFPTQSGPTASRLGHSLVVEGSFVRGVTRAPFFLAVDANPQYAGARYAPTRKVEAEVTRETKAVHAAFSVSAWLRALPIEELVTASGGAPIRVEKSGRAHDAVLIEMTVLHPVSFSFHE